MLAKPASMLATLLAAGPMLTLPVSLLFARPDLVASRNFGVEHRHGSELWFEICNDGLGLAGASITRVIIRRPCGEIVFEVPTPTIEPKGSTFVSVPMPDACEGEEEFLVVADARLAVVEHDESNNRSVIHARVVPGLKGLP